MKKVTVVMCMVVLLLCFVMSAMAVTVTVSNVAANVDMTLSYVEPSTNQDFCNGDVLITVQADCVQAGHIWVVGHALVDLDHTTIYYNIGAGPVVGKVVPASKLTGGGIIEETLSVIMPFYYEGEVSVHVTATDTSGNESTDSNYVKQSIDTWMPAPPK